MTTTMKLSLFVLVILLLGANTGWGERVDGDEDDLWDSSSAIRPGRDGRVSREAMVTQMNKRKDQFERLMIDSRKKLADNSAGEIQLSDEEKERHERRIGLLQRKIDALTNVPEERLVMMQKREESRWDRRNRRLSREL